MSLSFLLLSMIGCKPEPVEPTPNGPEFEMTINQVTKSSVNFTVEPLDKETPYLLMIIDKQTFDSFPSVDAYIEDDMRWIEEMAEIGEVSLEECLTDLLIVGDISDMSDGLQPNTEYILYAYHMTYSGEVISDLAQNSFKTSDYALNSDTFEITVSDITYTSALINVKPSSASTPYFLNVVSEEDLASYGGGQQAYTTHLEQLRDYYLSFGKTPEEMIANLCFVGEKSLTMANLAAGKKYYAYAMSVDEEFFVCSHVAEQEFETPSPTASSLTFEVDIEEYFYDHITGTVTPSNDDPYICTVQMAESLSWYETEEEYMASVIDELNWWHGGVDSALRTGVTDLSTYAGLYPETSYIVVCFGYDGAPNTSLFTYEFTTSAANGDPSKLEFEFEANDITHNSMSVNYKPSEGVYYFASLVPKEQIESYIEFEGSEAAALVAIANEEIDYGAYWFDCTRAEYLADLGASIGQVNIPFNQLSPSTDYVAYGVAVDMETGELASDKVSVSEVFRTLDKVVSDATVDFIFGNYYDGTALAELDAAQFNNCRGQVVVPYTVSVNDSAAAWYTTFSQGDYTEWGCTDDDIYAELITYGVDWGSDLVAINAESGVAVLPYDEPFSFLGIAEDMDGNFGVGTLEVVSFSKEGVSPAEEFIASLASALPAKAPAKAAVAPRGKRIFNRAESVATGMMNRPTSVSTTKVEEPTIVKPNLCKRIIAVR